MASFLKSKSKQEEATPRPVIIQSSGGSEHHDESNWLVSYADMMTLLCGFFILLFSMAKMDEPKYEKVKEAVAKQFGGKYESPSEALAKNMEQTIQKLGLADQVSLQADTYGVSIVFQSTLFFDTLSADVKTEGQTVLNRLIDSIIAQQQKDKKNFKVVVEGHTDGRPILAGPYPSNWELSGARASRVVRTFLERGFDPKSLAAIGYADTYAVAPERTASGEFDNEALAKNRRVVVRILDPRVDAIPLPKVEAATASSDTQIITHPDSPSTPTNPTHP